MWAWFETLLAVLFGYRAGRARARDEAVEETNAIARRIVAATDHAPADRGDLAWRLFHGPGA